MRSTVPASAILLGVFCSKIVPRCEHTYTQTTSSTTTSRGVCVLDGRRVEVVIFAPAYKAFDALKQARTRARCEKARARQPHGPLCQNSGLGPHTQSPSPVVGAPLSRHHRTPEHCSLVVCWCGPDRNRFIARAVLVRVCVLSRTGSAAVCEHRSELSVSERTRVFFCFFVLVPLAGLASGWICGILVYCMHRIIE